MYANPERKTCDFPEISGYGQWIVDTYKSIGLSSEHLSWQELKAWVDLSGIELEYEEVELIRELSNVFAKGLSDYSAVNIPMPYMTEETKIKAQKSINANMKAIFRGQQNA